MTCGRPTSPTFTFPDTAGGTPSPSSTTTRDTCWPSSSRRATRRPRWRRRPRTEIRGCGESPRRGDPRPAQPPAVPHHRQRPIVPRQAVPRASRSRLQPRAHPLPHAEPARSLGALPSDAEDRGGLLAPVRQSRPLPRLPGRFPGALQHRASTLGAEADAPCRSADPAPGLCRRRRNHHPALAARTGRPRPPLRTRRNRRCWQGNRISILGQVFGEESVVPAGALALVAV